MTRGVTTAGHHQQLLVMPDDGVQPVIDFIASAQRELRLKQFKLQSPAVLEALRQAHGRGVQLRVMLNPHTSGGDRWNDAADAAANDGEWDGLSQRAGTTHRPARMNYGRNSSESMRPRRAPSSRGDNQQNRPHKTQTSTPFFRGTPAGQGRRRGSGFGGTVGNKGSRKTDQGQLVCFS